MWCFLLTSIWLLLLSQKLKKRNELSIHWMMGFCDLWKLQKKPSFKIWCLQATPHPKKCQGNVALPPTWNSHGVIDFTPGLCVPALPQTKIMQESTNLNSVGFDQQDQWKMQSENFVWLIITSIATLQQIRVYAFEYVGEWSDSLPIQPLKSDPLN